MRRRLLAPLFCAGALLALAPPAHADEEIQARPPTSYASSSYTIDQGERLTFRNVDVSDHDVVANNRGPDGKALFSTPLIGTGESAFVENSQYLTTGHYDFFCSIHANMTGTLHVTSSGTPQARPGGGGGGGGGGSSAADKTKPKLRLKLKSTRASRVRRFNEIVAEVTVNEAAKVALYANARVGRRTKRIASGASELTAAGTRRPELKLTRAGKRALRKRRRLAVTISARAIDSAGNISTSRVRGTLKR